MLYFFMSCITFCKHPSILTFVTNLGYPWHRGVLVMTTAQLHSTKPELRFWAGSNPARGVLEIRDGEDLWQWSRLERRLNAFRRSTISQKQLIIIITPSSLPERHHFWMVFKVTESSWSNSVYQILCIKTYPLFKIINILVKLSIFARKCKIT